MTSNQCEKLRETIFKGCNHFQDCSNELFKLYNHYDYLSFHERCLELYPEYKVKMEEYDKVLDEVEARVELLSKDNEFYEFWNNRLSGLYDEGEELVET